MYDIKERVLLVKPKVGVLIDILKEMPQDADVVFCGDDCGYIHVERDKSVINIDTEDLDEGYVEDDMTGVEEYWENREKIEKGKRHE